MKSSLFPTTAGPLRLARYFMTIWETLTVKKSWLERERNNHERFWKQLTGTVTSKASHLQSQPSPPARPPHTNTHTLHVSIKDRARHEVRYKVAYKVKVRPYAYYSVLSFLFLTALFADKVHITFRTLLTLLSALLNHDTIKIKN